jgi:type II secretory pathway pseudopilin PulG
MSASQAILPRTRLRVCGFSLIEVAIALAITVFAIMSIVGLLGGALQSNRNSEQQIEAANLASSLLLQYRSALKGKQSDLPWPAAFPIPEDAVDNPPGTEFSKPVGISLNGKVLGGLDAKDVRFAFSYLISKQDLGPSAPYYLVNCSLRTEWPPAAVKAQGKAAEHFTAMTSILVRK